MKKYIFLIFSALSKHSNTEEIITVKKLWQLADLKNNFRPNRFQKPVRSFIINY